MMVSIRILDEIKDVDLLKEAWEWAEDIPQWFKESLAINKETLESFLCSARDELLVGVFVDGQVAIVVRFVPQPGVYELHLMAKRRTDWEILVNSCASIKKYVFDHGLKLAGWIPKRNRSIVKLYHSLGFTDNGIRCWQGKIHGKPVEWIYFQAHND